MPEIGGEGASSMTCCMRCSFSKRLASIAGARGLVGMVSKVDLGMV